MTISKIFNKVTGSSSLASPSVRRLLGISCTCAAWIFTLASVSLSTAATEVNFINIQQFEEALRAPVKVRTLTGQLFEGVPTRSEHGAIVFKVFSGSGEIELPIKREDIADIAIPGSEYKRNVYELMEYGRYNEALTLLKPLYAQRVRFFPVLEEEAEFFVTAVDANIAAGKPLDAVAIAKRLKPYITKPALIRKLDEAIIIGHYKDPLILYEESRALAQEWLAEARRYDDSALGWWIISQIDFEEKRYTDARRMAMKPIVFSGQLPVRYLQHCYAVAVAAAFAMEDEKHARLLLEEMTARGLTWPEIENLPNIPQTLAEQDIASENEDRLPHAGTSASPAPGIN